jgi:DnaJ-class molecular chaperone
MRTNRYITVACEACNGTGEVESYERYNLGVRIVYVPCPVCHGLCQYTREVNENEEEEG